VNENGNLSQKVERGPNDSTLHWESWDSQGKSNGPGVVITVIVPNGSRLEETTSNIRRENENPNVTKYETESGADSVTSIRIKGP